MNGEMGAGIDRHFNAISLIEEKWKQKMFSRFIFQKRLKKYLMKKMIERIVNNKKVIKYIISELLSFL